MVSNTELPRVLVADAETSPVQGEVHWSPSKSLWLTFHTLVEVAPGNRSS